MELNDLDKLFALKEKGALTQEEFDAKKKELLDGVGGGAAAGGKRDIFSCYGGCFSKYFQFSGRATRFEYWSFVLVNFLISLVLYVFDFALGISLVSTLYALAALIPNLAVLVRRVHDTGRSAWHAFSPFLWMVALVVLAVISSIVEYASGVPAGSEYVSAGEAAATGGVFATIKTIVFICGGFGAVASVLYVFILTLLKSENKKNKYGDPVVLS